MNHIADNTSLRNRYFSMRHGESNANLADKIVSHEDNALSNSYGLTDLGRQQVLQAAQNSGLNSKTIIYSSDYVRAKETAEIVRRILQTAHPHFTDKLRERFFGQWEMTSTANYKTIWKDDAHKRHNSGVESPENVLDRVTQLIADLEKEYQDKDILLISHGDTLQILQCGFYKINPSKHRDLPHLGIAEIRALILKAH